MDSITPAIGTVLKWLKGQVGDRSSCRRFICVVIKNWHQLDGAQSINLYCILLFLQEILATPKGSNLFYPCVNTVICYHERQWLTQDFYGRSITWMNSDPLVLQRLNLMSRNQNRSCHQKWKTLFGKRNVIKNLRKDKPDELI